MWTHPAQLQSETGVMTLRCFFCFFLKINSTTYNLRYCWSSCSVPGVAGWLGVAGCGFPTISTCLKTDTVKKSKEVIAWNNKGKKKLQTELHLWSWCGCSCGEQSRLGWGDKQLHHSWARCYSLRWNRSYMGKAYLITCLLPAQIQM